MSRKTEGPEPGTELAFATSPARKSRLIRWFVISAASAYAIAALAGLRLDARAGLLAYLPPIAGFVLMSLLFASTLRDGHEPFISRVARREHPHLPPELARYTRGLTILWIAAFILLAVTSAILANALTFQAWSRWTSALGIAVTAFLLLGEYAYRRARFAEYAHAPPTRLVANIVAVMREYAAHPGTSALPLLQCRSVNDPFLLDHNHTVVVAQFVGQVEALAAALPEGTHVVNVCSGRHAFLVAFGAALLRGQVSLMPTGATRADWERVIAKYPGARLLGDTTPAETAGEWFDVTPYLASDAYSTSIPRIDADRTAAILFTSGSTGESVGYAKTWRQLWNGAAIWADALGWRDMTRFAVLGSVPPQHMFGLEATVMLPFYAGVPVHAHQPLLPADTEAALRRSGRSYWWMTTPTHLRATLASTVEAPQLVGIVSSTMSLPVSTARNAEGRLKVPVLEIYGSTETGLLATRRTALEEWWSPVRDVGLRLSEEGVVVERGRIAAPLTLGDILEFAPDGRFLWRGRHADLVKVAGKRESLAALEKRLRDIEGIDDCAFYAPDEVTGSTRRLTAFYVSTILEPEAVLEALRQAMDPIFVPRPLFRVARMPRNANGKLTRAALAELYAACHSPDRFVIGEDHPCIAGHFPGRPIVPAAVILSRVALAIRDRFPAPRPGAIASARFHAPLFPGNHVTIGAREDGAEIAFDVRRGEEMLVSGKWRRE